MSQAEFLRSLERGLRAFPDAERAAILSDYQRYFADGLAAGRTEADVAISLGNPGRVAAELALGRDVRAWNGSGGARSPFRTLRALIALLLIDGLLWLPAMAAVFVLLLTLGAGFLALVYGVFTLTIEVFDDPLGGIGASLLRATALVSAGVGLLLISSAALHGVASLLTRRIPKSNEVSP